MTISTSAIDKFVDQQVQSGYCASTHEAEQQLIGELMERELDQKIARSRASIKA